VSHGNNTTGLSLVTDGEPRVDGYVILWGDDDDDEFLYYECPRCHEIHYGREGRQTRERCDPIALVAFGWRGREPQGVTVHIVRAGRVTKAQYSAWEARRERRFLEALSKHLHERALIHDLYVGAKRLSRDVTPRQRARILERDGFKCRRCGNGPDVAPLEIDHVVPVALGGATTTDNLQTLCQPCNVGKSATFPHPHDMAATA
jgi:5-methylcytosine-specific restriction endonuclease McrA